MYAGTCIPQLHQINLQKQITVPLAKGLSVRLYEDTRPHCMETAALQKGLILMLDNQELVDEGLGFGVPVAKYSDKTYFSSSAEVSIQETSVAVSLKKTYILDTISKKKLGKTSYIDDGVYSSMRKSFEKLYLTRKKLSPIFNRVMELRELAKIKTEFIKVKPRGVVTVDYEVQPSSINVNFDFSGLTLAGCEEVLVLNEQGSTTFEKYADTSGSNLSRRAIGAWDAVAAQRAAMMNAEEQFSFVLKRIRGAKLFRGWERTRNRFSWAGLSYSMQPNHGTFAYAIRLDSKKHFDDCSVES